MPGIDEQQSARRTYRITRKSNARPWAARGPPPAPPSHASLSKPERANTSHVRAQALIRHNDTRRNKTSRWAQRPVHRQRSSRSQRVHQVRRAHTPPACVDFRSGARIMAALQSPRAPPAADPGKIEVRPRSRSPPRQSQQHCSAVVSVMRPASESIFRRNGFPLRYRKCDPTTFENTVSIPKDREVLLSSVRSSPRARALHAPTLSRQRPSGSW